MDPIAFIRSQIELSAASIKPRPPNPTVDEIRAALAESDAGLTCNELFAACPSAPSRHSVQQYLYDMVELRELVRVASCGGHGKRYRYQLTRKGRCADDN